MWLLPPQKWPLSHHTNSRWWQAYLLLIPRFSCCNPIGGETSFQRRHFNPCFPIYLHIYRRLFLCSPMERFGYIKIPFRWIPEELRTQYNIYSLVEPDSYVYYEVRKGMYELKKLASLAFDDLVRSYPPPLFPCQIISPFMDTSDPTHCVYPFCRQFWYQIQLHRGRASITSSMISIMLQILNRLGR